MRYRGGVKSPSYPEIEETKEYWKQEAQERLLREVNHADTNRKAKNVIIFLGDGMGVSTLTAGGDCILGFSSFHCELY